MCAGNITGAESDKRREDTVNGALPEAGASRGDIKNEGRGLLPGLRCKSQWYGITRCG